MEEDIEKGETNVRRREKGTEEEKSRGIRNKSLSVVTEEKHNLRTACHRDEI
jgi:hypothetical protein